MYGKPAGICILSRFCCSCSFGRTNRRGAETSACSADQSASDRMMNGSAVPDQIRMCFNELLERCFYRQEINIGDESINGGVDTGRLCSECVATHRNEVC